MIQKRVLFLYMKNWIGKRNSLGPFEMRRNLTIKIHPLFHDYFKMVYNHFEIIQMRIAPLYNKIANHKLKILMDNANSVQIRQSICGACGLCHKVNRSILGIYQSQRNYSCHYSKKNLTKDTARGNSRLAHRETSELAKRCPSLKTSVQVLNSGYSRSEMSSKLFPEDKDENLRETSIPFTFDDFLKDYLVEKNVVEDIGSSSDQKLSETKSESDSIKHALCDDEDRSKSTRNNTRNEEIKLSTELQDHLKQLEREGFSFNLPQSLSHFKKNSPLVCPICKQKGHLKIECPSHFPALQFLPAINKKYTNFLSEICEAVFDEHTLSDAEMRQRQDFAKELNEYLKLTYDKDVQLELSGSSCHGFGFKNSDVDLIFTFANNEREKNSNHVKIIETVAEKLKQHQDFHNINVGYSSLIPIVEFVHGPSRLEGDITSGTFLPLYKTRLLKTYGEIDPRVKILGCVMKYFLQMCGVRSTVQGGMTSFAYMLMVIYYLQQRRPPVIPVLQELYDKSKPCPEMIVEGWNTWFFDDIKNLKTVWPEYGKNKETIGELWLGLLRFYAEEFKFLKHVISVSQLAPLSLLEKRWKTPRVIAIEDPFDLEYNHGVVLTEQMSEYIKRVIIEGRNSFANPPAKLKHLLQNSQGYR